MITIKAEKRNPEEKSNKLREQGFLPAVVYGQKGENFSIKMSSNEFAKVFEEAGESTLIALKLEGKDIPVLVHDIQEDPIKRNFIHIDFYQPSLTEKTEANVSLVFEGESFAVKNLSGTLIKDIDEIEVRALPQDLPHEIRVDISVLKSFEDVILVKDLQVPKGVEILKDMDEVVASISAPQNIEKELETPIEENVEKVELAEKKKAEEEPKEE